MFGGKTIHCDAIAEKCQTQPTKVLALPLRQASQDDYNDTPQPVCEFYVATLTFQIEDTTQKNLTPFKKGHQFWATVTVTKPKH